MLDKGKAKRTYLYVSDAVEMLLLIGLNGKHPIYNIGGKSKLSIKDLADKIGKITKATVKLPNKSTPLKGSPNDVKLNTKLFESEFKKNNFININRGLQKTIKWHLACLTKQ